MFFLSFIASMEETGGGAMEELGALVRAVTHGEMSAGAALREVEVLARGKQRKMMQEGAGASLALEAARVRRGAERWKAEADS